MNVRASWKVDEAQRIVSRLSPERLACWRPIEERAIAGAGVDVATGQVVFAEEDGTVAGPPALALRRTYCSGFAHREGVCGPGWTLSLDQRIERERAGFVLFDEEGRELLFEHAGEPRAGITLRHALDPDTRLRCLGPGMFSVEDRWGRTLTFEARDPTGVARLRSIEVGAASAWIAHDGEGRPVEVTAGGHTLELAYADGRLHAARVVVGGERLELARYEYDGARHLARVRAASGLERRYEVVAGLLVSRQRPDGSGAYYGYDDAGSAARCVRTWTDGGYDDRTLRYRRGGTTVVDATGAAHAFAHDALYRPLELPSGRVTYDPISLGAVRFEGPEIRREAILDGGAAIAITEADGSTTRFERDAAGRTIARADPMGARVEVRLANGEVVERVEDGWRTLLRRSERGATEIVLGDEWLEVEGDRDRPRRVALRDEVWTARYDAHGRPAELSGPDGERRFEHDALGRLVGMSVDGARAAFERDGEGRLVRARTPEGDWTIERDRGGMPRAVARPDFACELRFDRERRLVEVRDRRGRRWTFERDRGGRVVAEVDFDGREHRYAYSGLTSRVASMRLPGGARLRATYDAAGRLARAEHGKLHVDRFRYDAAGRLVEASRDDASVVLTRDRRGAVVNERSGGDEVGARRDARGRRVLVVSSLGARITRTWGPRGERVLEIIAPDGSRHEVRLAGEELATGALRVARAPDDPPLRSSGEGEVERDALGRVAAWTGPDRRRFSYAYGADGLLERVTLPDGDAWSFAYDAFGRRTAATSARWDARWVWDGGVALHELTSYAAPTLYVFDPADGAPIGKVQPGAARWLGLHQDFVCLFDPGSPRVPTIEYWPWRGGLQIDFPTGVWLGHARAFHPRAAEPMGLGTLSDELFGPAARRPFEYRPHVAALLERASDRTLDAFLHRLTTPPWLELPRVPIAPWPEPIAAPRLMPAGVRV